MMTKRILALVLLLSLLLTLAACGGEPKIVHCDRCGAEIQLDPDDSHIDEDWILFCKTCEEEAFGDDGVVSSGN